MARQTPHAVRSRRREALRLCAEDIPAIVILDVVMPKLGGVATAQKLQIKAGKRAK